MQQPGQPAAGEVRGHLDAGHRAASVRLGSKAFFRAYGIWLLTLAAVIFAPWWAKIPLAILNGGVIATLFLVGHDAAHGSLFPRRWMNRWSGRLSLLPALHPLSSWVHTHNRLHHAFTSIKEKDPSLPPLSPTEYAALSGWGRWLHRRKRTWYGLGLYYFLDIWWKWEFFPTVSNAPKNPRAFRKDRLLVAAFVLLWVGGLGFSGWWRGEGIVEMILVGFILPQIAWNWLIGSVIFQQHTHPQIPWYSEKDRPAPTYFDGQVRATPHIEFATPFRGLIRHIMEHTAHHADPLVPHYRLASAQEKMESVYPEEIIRVKWTIPTFLELFRVCRLYDYSTHRWVDFDGLPLTEPLHVRSPQFERAPAKELPKVSNELSDSAVLAPAV